jgi:hypothetical protein
MQETTRREVEAIGDLGSLPIAKDSDGPWSEHTRAYQLFCKRVAGASFQPTGTSSTSGQRTKGRVKSPGAPATIDSQKKRRLKRRTQTKADGRFR